MAGARGPKHVLAELELAAIAGVSDWTWKQHKKQGAPVPKSRADLTAWLKRYHSWRKANGKGTTEERRAAAPASGTQLGDPEGQRWTNERKKWLAMLAKMEFGIRMRELVPRREVVEFASKAALTLRNRLNQLAQKLGAQFGDDVMEAAQQEVDDALASFERGLEPAHEHRAQAATADPGSGDPVELPAAEEADGE